MFSQGVEGLALKYSDNDSDWSNCFTPFNPASDKALWKSFAEQTHRYFKLVLPAGYTAAPQIGILFIGGFMQFPSWPSGRFDPDEQEIVFSMNRNRAGHLLGANEFYRRREISAEFQVISFAWFASTFMPFWNTHVPRPFFWIWDETNHSGEVYLVAMDKGMLSSPMGPNSRTLKLDLIGVVE
jgi:hypothetical protein